MMISHLRHLALAGVVAGGLGAAAAPQGASADTLAALTGDRTLVLIDEARRRVTGRVDARVASRLVGIDVRAADGLLYGVTAAGQIVTINPRSGTATSRGNLTLALPAVQLSVDINPVADAIRIVGANDDNLRHPFATGVTVADTDLAFPAPAPQTGPFGDELSPTIVAVAYTNTVPGANVPGTTATQLYDIDASPAALYLQVPANAGTLSAVGRIDAALGSSLGFDIATDRRGRNRGLIVANNRLIEIDVSGGAVVSDRRISGLNAAVRDLAALR